jgi:uncharacterized protein (TIGR03067 family)
MRRCLLLTGLCLAGLALVTSPPLLYPQKPAGKDQPRPKGIEGVWTEVLWEEEGMLISMVPRAMIGVNRRFHLWKISKGTIEKGETRRDAFELDPGGQAGAIDLLPPDKKGQRTLGIYVLKGDYLLLCFGRKARPKAFTHSEENPARIYVLRRGEVADPGARVLPEGGKKGK